MTKPILQRVLKVAIVAALSASCGGDATIRGCNISGNYAARNSNIQVYVDEPYRCDFTIMEPGSAVNILVGFFAPSNWYVGRLTIHVMFAWLSGGNWQQVGEEIEITWISGAECGNQPACIALTGAWSAATGDPIGARYTDQYRVAGATPIGDALFHIDFTGIVGSFANIGGPSSFVGGSSATWQANVVGDTLSYRYTWLVNGTPMAATRSFSSSLGWLESGSHTIMGIARLMDQTTDTVTKAVSLQMGAAWTGPTYIGHGELGTWQAIGYAARQPLQSCQWYLDGNTLLQSGACTLHYAFPNPQMTHTLSVLITDARGITAEGFSSVQVYTSGCIPPECNESLRTPESIAPKAPPRVRPRVRA